MPRTLRKEAIFDKTGSQVLAHKSATELKQMLSTGEVIHVCRRCGSPATARRCVGVSAKKQPHQPIYAATDLFRETRMSNTSISLAEVLANVGIADTVGRVKAAQRKIRAWPLVGDTKAVRVGHTASGDRVIG